MDPMCGTELYVQDHVGLSGWHSHKACDYCNVGGDNEWSNLRLVETICELVDSQLNNPKGTAGKLITFVNDRPGHDFRYAIDADKIRRELGWKPAYDFESAMEMTVDWYLSNPGLGGDCDVMK